MGEDMPTIFLIDGIDRLGKSTLVKSILENQGYHVVIHYDKPQVLGSYELSATMIKELDSDYKEIEHLPEENIAKYLYQEDTNHCMFELMKSKAQIIFDRTHLGEMVYAPLYRQYKGDYVYGIEEEFIKNVDNKQLNSVRMILLVSSNTEMLKDDGLSFDPTKKEEEQQRFVDAFNRSKLPNKVIVDVHDGKGGYRSLQDIYEEAMYKSAK